MDIRRFFGGAGATPSTTKSKQSGDREKLKPLNNNSDQKKSSKIPSKKDSKKSVGKSNSDKNASDKKSSTSKDSKKAKVSESSKECKDDLKIKKDTNVTCPVSMMDSSIFDTEEASDLEEDNRMKQSLSLDSEKVIQIDDDDEDITTIKRSAKSRKKKSTTRAKKAALVVESDSDDEPKKKKPRQKIAKKREVTYVSGSDDEPTVKKGMQSIKSAFNKVTPKSQTTVSKTPASSSDKKPTERKKVNAADFFGSSKVHQVERQVITPKSANKRKAEDSIDLTDGNDYDIHDDDDFAETLRLIDEQEKEKAHKKQKTDSSPSGMTLANKLANKMKAESSSFVPETPEKEMAASKGEDHHKNSPIKKHIKDGKSSPKKKEVTPPKKHTHPKSPKAEKVITPPKDDVQSAKSSTPATSAAAKLNKEGSIIETPKESKKGAGYRNFMAREGPRALGSKEIPEGGENCLEGLVFVVTGILESFERDETKSLLERYGAKVTQSISKKTDYIIVGRDAGVSKLDKAEKLKTKQIDEDGMLDLIRTRPGKKSKYVIQAELEAKAAARTIKSTSIKNENKLETKTSKEELTKKNSTLPATSSKSTSSPNESRNAASESLLWVDKYKPKTMKQIIGQQGDKSNAKKLMSWLQQWHKNRAAGKKPVFNRFNDDGSGHKAALLSGPPGVGKTTTSQIVCQELGFSFIELNASDTRSKKTLDSQVSECLNNHSLADMFGSSKKNPNASGKMHCLIMDEVDGMAGNEDRGGVSELIALIKKSRIPIICMCNDRNHQKIRSLVNHCFDLRFQRPRVEQIKSAMMSLAFKEGLQIPPAALNEVIQASNQDIRQVIHNLSMWSAAEKALTFDQLKADADKARKDIKLGPFDACRKVFASGEETANMSLIDKSDLFFHDYSFMPLFVHENYIHVTPRAASGNTLKHLKCLSEAADGIAQGDIVDRKIRSSQAWGLLPTQAIFSSVVPGECMRGYMKGMIQFPQWLGKNSTKNKNHRILQELRTHMRLKISGDKRSLNLDYLPNLRTYLTHPLSQKGSDGVSDVVDKMTEYDLLRDDFDNIISITQWPGKPDPMAKVESKVKAAFTRAYNKSGHLVPYAIESTKKGRGRGGGGLDMEGLDEEQQTVESDEEKDDDKLDGMIKAKKAPAKSRASASKKPAAGGKGKGKGKGKSKN